jgi:tRNA-dihydrouridine synthase 3
MDKQALQALFKDSSVLAPLTRVGNLPFRRLCREFGASVTYSEMIYARNLLKGAGWERALLRKHADETCFGVQLAALQLEEGIEAAKFARERGADFIDINCGCPIEDTTRRGLGAALLRRSRTLVKLIDGLVKNLDCAVTAKLRIGWNLSSVNIFEIARELEQAGAAAITIHGRTRDQRYTSAADWDLIGRVQESISIPVIGNGDILTSYEAVERRKKSGVKTVMLARGALIKPWLFEEIRDNTVLRPTPQERIAIYHRLSRFELEHFGADDLGRKRSLEFLTYQFNFLHRFKYLPEETFGAQSREYPLMQSRLDPDLDTPLDCMLSCPDPAVHREISLILLDTEDASEAVARLTEYAAGRNFPTSMAEGEIISNG